MLLNSLTKSLYDCLNRLLAFESRIGLAANIGGGAPSLGEEAGEDGVQEGSEDNLSSVGHGESHPEDQHEFEDVVEC